MDRIRPSCLHGKLLHLIHREELCHLRKQTFHLCCIQRRRRSASDVDRIKCIVFHTLADEGQLFDQRIQIRIYHMGPAA